MIQLKEIHSVNDTGQSMKYLVDKFHADLCEYGYNDFTLNEFFNFVKNLPYKKDVEPIEIIARPKHILKMQSFDCKKKSILIASWAECNGIKWDFIGVSSRPDKDIHHVIVRLWIDGTVQDVDSTYPDNELINYKWTNEKTLSGNEKSIAEKPVLLILSGNNDDKEFQKLTHDIYMGEAGGIIAAVVAGVAAITSGIIAAVSARRRQREAQEYAIELEQQRAQLQQEQAQRIAELVVYYGIPAAGILGLTIFILSRNK